MKTVNGLAGCVALASLAAALSGCAPVVVGGAAVGGAVAATDRRTSGDLLDDQGIELRASRQIHDLVGGAAHVNVTSWNGRVLLTGEVPGPSDRLHAEKIARSVAGVREVINELGVMPASSMLTRTQDTFLTGMVKAALAGSANVAATNVKVVTERSVVYLMGRVTPEEAAAAAEAASQVSGVQRVVRAFEYGVPSGTTTGGGWFSTPAGDTPVNSNMPDVGQDASGSFYQSAPLNTPVLGSGSNTSWYPPYPDTNAVGNAVNSTVNNAVNNAVAPVLPNAGNTAGTWYTPAETVNGVYTTPSVATPYPYTAPAPQVLTAPAPAAPQIWTAPPAVQDLAPLPVQVAPIADSPLR